MTHDLDIVREDERAPVRWTVEMNKYDPRCVLRAGANWIKSYSYRTGNGPWVDVYRLNTVRVADEPHRDYGDEYQERRV